MRAEAHGDGDGCTAEQGRGGERPLPAPWWGVGRHQLSRVRPGLGSWTQGNTAHDLQPRSLPLKRRDRGIVG